jgi:hypothetical protein
MLRCNYLPNDPINCSATGRPILHALVDQRRHQAGYQRFTTKGVPLKQERGR